MAERVWKKIICGGAWLSALAAWGNPIDARLDGAMLSYNGRYYAMSAETNGLMLVSDDLLTWNSPAAVLPDSMNGPYELLRRNGLFYLYAEGRGVAYSDQPNAGYSAMSKSGLSGEQARLYQDAGGALFSVHRRPGSKEEGEIWLRSYSHPWRVADKPRKLLDGRRGQWDSIDSTDLGAPDMLRYRDNYYLLYAANHPGPRTGLREIGLAMNEEPSKFSNEDKTSDPVLTRNVNRLSYEYEPVLPSGEFGAWSGRYTTEEPEGNWTESGYRYSGWRTGDGGFGAPDEVDGAQLFACRTRWEAETLHVRREFDCDRGIPETPVLNIRHEAAVQVFLNGKMIYESAESVPAYANIDVSAACEGLFLEEDNVLAARARASDSAEIRFLDFGIYDAKGETVEPTVYGLDAPRIVTGPNGFEKWMLYQAWWNGRPGSGLDRVFFYDQELVVDGPTSATVEGRRSSPTPPTFSDAFPEDEGLDWAERWEFLGGEWAPYRGAMRQASNKGTAKAYLKREPMSHYLFETDLRFPRTGRGEVGVVAWSDGEFDLIVSINRSAGTWQYHIEPGNVAPKKFRLPRAFRFLETPPGAGEVVNPLHRLRVEKNGGDFKVALNGLSLTPENPISTKAVGPGLPGFYCRDSAAEFDAVTYTVGWDEHDRLMTGWGAANDGTSFGGEWRPHRDLGMEQRSHSVVGRAFKGDPMDQYEFTVNAQLYEYEDGKDRLYGVFPVFADKNNYLKAMIDTRERKLVVTGVLDGREIRPRSADLGTTLERRHLYDQSTSYRDVTSWVYELRSESIISGMDIRWLEGDFEHLRQEFLIPSDDMAVRYAKLRRGRRPNLWEDGRFFDADQPKPKQQAPNVFNAVNLREETGNFIGLGFYTSGIIVVDSRTGRYIRPYNGGPLGDDEEISDDTGESDSPARPQSAMIRLEVESSYFFRCVKLKDRVIIELNGRPMIEVEGAWPLSQVGVITEGQPTFFNGTTLHHIPAEE